MLLSREVLVALNPRAHFSFIPSKARRLYIVELYRTVYIKYGPVHCTVLMVLLYAKSVAGELEMQHAG